MNRLIACAVLGTGLASSVVGCSDDDDVTPGNEAGSNAGGTSSAGKNAGGSSTQAGSSTTAGKGGGGSAGTGGKASGGSGGSGTGGDAGAGIGGDSLGGEAGIGGDAMGGAGGEAGAPPEEPAQTANPYWLNKFCDSHASETVDCSNAVSWSQCYGQFYPYLSVDGGNGICSNETDTDNFPLTLAVIEALDGLAAKCPDTTEADWSCDLQGTPQPKDQACKDANDAARAALIACEY